MYKLCITTKCYVYVYDFQSGILFAGLVIFNIKCKKYKPFEFKNVEVFVGTKMDTLHFYIPPKSNHFLQMCFNNVKTTILIFCPAFYSVLE